MAWIRRVRTASGATAVQIAESVNGRRRIDRHLGSAHDEAELGLLIEHAQQLLIDDSQQTLDLGLTPTVPRHSLVPAPSAGALLPDTSTPAGTGRERVPRARVLRSAAAPLYEAGQRGHEYRLRRDR